MSDIKKNENLIGVSSSGCSIYCPIDYEYSEKEKCMIPVFNRKLDRYKMIQASKNATDISAILARAKAGDISVLHVRDEVYADVSNVPDNINDVHALNIEALNGWSKLDPNLKKLFDNDYNKFSEAIENGSYVDVINNALKVENVENKESEENK